MVAMALDDEICRGALEIAWQGTDTNDTFQPFHCLCRIYKNRCAVTWLSHGRVVKLVPEAGRLELLGVCFRRNQLGCLSASSTFTVFIKHRD